VRGVERLVSAVQDLSLARDLATVCEIVRHAAREMTGADGATFVLRDQDRCHYVDEDAIAPLWKGKKFPMSICISGWVMTHREPVIVPDVFADARIPREAYLPTFVKSMAMVPIRAVSPIGAIGNYWAAPRAADAREVSLLQALADSTSVALENIQVYNELEQRVRERTQQLQAANRELEAFSSSVSHDLRTPLASIIGFADLMAADQELNRNPVWQQRVQRIVHAARRMNGLIDDLLNLAQITRAELMCEEIDLADLARQALQGLRREAAERRVEVILPTRMPAFGDPRLLRIVLDNLLSNAWKYTSKRECATIEIGLREGSSSPTYFVRDDGAGFDMQQSSKLFTPFERLHSQAEFPGTGVGLTTVQRIIHKHGGAIWAQSEKDRGATFFFTLPARAPAGPAASDSLVRH
jgi:signal transduction histidine kinase